MEYQKIVTLLDDTTNQSLKFRTRNLFEINDELRGTCNVNSYTKFKSMVIRSNLCDYSHAYIHVNRTRIFSKTAAATVPVNNTNKKVTFKSVFHLLIL